MVRKIIHVDLDAFFCAVEEQLNPELRGIPFAVGGKPQERGVVASCSYAARKFGIRSAMPMARAIKLCPELITVSSHFHEYAKISRNIFDRLSQLTDQIEQVSIDEAFLEVSNIPRTADSIAKEIQQIIRNEFGLPSSLGVATNKLVAKIATDVGKTSHLMDSPPYAITVVKPGNEASFLDPLPTESLWGVGPKTAAKLEEMGIYKIGDIARWSQDDLIKRFGKHGELISRYARGIDDRPINTVHIIKSISRETTFSNDTRNERFIEDTFRSLSENVALRLKRSNLIGSTVKIKIRWSDFTTLSRQITLSSPTDNFEELNHYAMTLLDEVWDKTKPIRLIGVGVTNLSSPNRQLSFWDTDVRSTKLEQAVSELKDRFGEDIVVRGSNIPEKNE